MKFLTAILFVVLMSSCSSTHNKSSERGIANTRLLQSFVRSLARKSTNVAAHELELQIQKAFKEVLLHTPDGSDVGNWARMGITREQAMKIETLYDDLPYMNKVHQWIMENVTVLSKTIKPSVARAVFDEITGNTKALLNPYHGMSDDLAELSLTRRNQNRPGSLVNNNASELNIGPSIFDDISAKQRRIATATESIPSTGVESNAKKYILDHLDLSDDFVKANPILASNINLSAESAVKILKKTGKRPLGAGCKQFNEGASSEILELKSRVDMRRAQIIEEKAYLKAGDNFNSFDEIDDSLRLTQKEIDEATEEAFEEVLGYTKVEARTALKRLQSKPCKVY